MTARHSLDLVYNLAILSYVCHVEKGRAWVSDPAAARSENVALPFIFAWFALFDAKKVARRFIPGPPGGALVYNLAIVTSVARFKKR